MVIHSVRYVHTYLYIVPSTQMQVAPFFKNFQYFLIFSNKKRILLEKNL